MAGEIGNPGNDNRLNWNYINTQTHGKWAGGDLTPDQIHDPQLTQAEAISACGPAAAVAFARRNGRTPTLREAVDLAQGVGWTAAHGMAGISSQKALMDKMGIPSVMDPSPTEQSVKEQIAQGNPVIISSGLHYFVADGYDPDKGFRVGVSGTALRGGAPYMTWDAMDKLSKERSGSGTGINGAFYAGDKINPSTDYQPTDPMWKPDINTGEVNYNPTNKFYGVQINGKLGTDPTTGMPVWTSDPQKAAEYDSIEQAKINAANSDATLAASLMKGWNPSVGNHAPNLVPTLNTNFGGGSLLSQPSLVGDAIDPSIQYSTAYRAPGAVTPFIPAPMPKLPIIGG